MFVMTKVRALCSENIVTFAGVSADLLLAWYSSKVFARREMIDRRIVGVIEL